ncbi:MAG: hypothetical protein P1U77_13720 [Rubripirellula sp.]|jgi:hypothetical protein|nr:hypothetical protein [Planctomycetaceae bacterium]MDF1842491.1 hypothetical protein [Rubripirellula sp.]
MSEILLYYKRPDPTTWVYMSSFLTIGLYFVFHRFWSVRNLDIVLLILLAPGLLVVYEGRRREIRQTELLVRKQVEQEKDYRPAKHMTSVLSVLPVLALAQLGDDSAGGQTESEEPATRDTPPLASTTKDNEARRDAESSASAPIAVRPPETSTTTGATPDNASNDVIPNNLSGEGEVVAPNEVDEADEGYTANEADIFSPTDVQRWGFIYLFVIEAFLLVRLILDPLMVRRPLLDPNLTTGGLNFIGISLFIFMMANVIASSPRIQVEQGPKLGPGYALMNMLPAIPTRPVSESIGGALPIPNEELNANQARLSQIAKSLAIAAQLALVVAIVLIGNRHFSNLRAGVGCATLYLMLPYTAQFTGRVDHALPAALLLWAVLSYRRPMIAGIFLGLAGGLVYYPLFLLPLWISFYWQRGARQFSVGVVAMLVVLMVGLWFDDSASLWEHLRRMFGILNPNREIDQFRGIWALGWNPIWRLPAIVAFVILSVFFAIWPAQKNLGTLMSGTAVIMVASQFWHGYFGGLYLAWFLPLLLLTIFRPNLQDRIATKVVIDGPTQPRGNKSEIATV